MSYYTTKKVLEIISNYHTNIELAKELSRDMASVGVAQYGIDAAMPKGNNISNVVEKEALRQIGSSKILADIMTDVKYLQDRWDRVTDEQDAIVLKLRLDGLSVSEISYLQKQSKRNIYNRLDNIAKAISCPQEECTNCTD